MNKEELLERLESLAELKEGWDPEGAPPPSLFSLQRAKDALLGAFEINLLPVKVCPSVEGGVGLIFLHGTLYADIEFLNEGSVLACTSNRQCSDIWEVEVVSQTLDKIRRFLNTT